MGGNRKIKCAKERLKKNTFHVELIFIKCLVLKETQ